MSGLADTLRAAFVPEASGAKDIRAARANLARLRKELERAQKLEANARAQLGQVEPVRAKLQKLHEADAEDRRERVESGRTGSSGALRDKIADAERALAESERNEAALHAALPSLEARTRESKWAVESAVSRLDELAWNFRCAELTRELPEVKAAAEVVSDFARRIAVLRDVSRRWKGFNVPHGVTPPELIKACTLRAYDFESRTFFDEFAADEKVERERLVRIRDSL